MIRHLTGTVFAAASRQVVVTVNNIGYEVLVPDHISVPANPGDEIALWTHEHIRDNAHELFGFIDQNELLLFQKLIEVSGVGPRSALGILSIAPLGTLVPAICNKDTSYLTKVSGIGKKTAEKVVLELHDKLDMLGIVVSSDQQDNIDTLEALESLGYRSHDIRAALQQLPPEATDTQAKIRAALQILGK